MDSTPTGASPGTSSRTAPPIRDRRGVVVGGRFEIRDLLARGGMSEVWAAKDLHARGPAAIKIFRKDRPEARPRFAVEAEVLSRLDHAHIVGLLDYGDRLRDESDGATDDDKVPYIALKLVRGETLGAELSRRGRLPWREVVEIGAQLADALHSLHSLGVIHRDVKPLNVMRCEGTAVKVKLIDLGLCRLLDTYVQAQSSPPYRRRLTSLDMGPLGTAGYIPPEAAEAGQTALGDVFALGVTLYQLLAGVVPQSCGFAPLEGDVPPDLAQLIMSALTPDPSERLPSADHVRRGLEAIRLAHPDVGAAPHLFAGKYDRMQLLGVGAQSQTFAAYDRQIERTLALKVLSTDSADDRRRFERAAKILGLLRHPNVPTVYEVGTYDDQAYAAIELCHGTKATELAKPNKHLGPEAVISIGLQLAEVLDAAHAAGIVYRDLHMGNLLIDGRGDAPRAWLFDFDHSQVSSVFWSMLPQRWATPPEKRRDPPDKPLVTMDYAAPEVRRGEPFTPASDVFALGLCLYRLLTGMRPFPPGGGELVPASERCETCADALDMLLTQMLHADPAARPRLEEVRKQLHEARDEIVDQRGEVAVRRANDREPQRSTPTDPAPSGRSEARSLWPRLRLGVGLVGALALAWSLGHVQGGHERELSADDRQADVTRGEPSASVPAGLPQPQETPGPAAPEREPQAPQVAASANEALAAEDSRLRACAAEAGRPVTIELSARDGATRFDTIDVMTADPTVTRCFRDILDLVRFAPQSSMLNLFPEYLP